MPFDFKSDSSIPRPKSDPSYGSNSSSIPRPDSSSASEAPSRSGFSNRPSFYGNDSSGQRNVPQPRREQPPQPSRDNRNNGRTRPDPRIRRNTPSVDIPWGIVFGVVAIIAVIALGIIFHDEITSFFMEILQLLFYLVIILAILKFLIFPSRRR